MIVVFVALLIISLFAAGTLYYFFKSAIAAVLALALLAGLSFAVTSIHRVGEREVGIVTEFGRYQGTASEAGLHFYNPWTQVDKLETTTQTVDVIDLPLTFGSADEEGNISVGGGRGDLDATVRWTIDTTGSDKKTSDNVYNIWTKYKDFDRVSPDLVERTVKDELLNAANDYPASEGIISQEKIGTAATENSNEKLAQYGIKIDSISVTSIVLDDKTQGSVDKIFNAQQDTLRATEENERASIDADTLRIQEESGALSPEGNARYCLEITNKWSVSGNGSLPATWNCGLGSTGGNDVIVNSPSPSSE